MTEAFYGEVFAGRGSKPFPDSRKRRALVKHFLEARVVDSSFGFFWGNPGKFSGGFLSLSVPVRSGENSPSG
jgi:hypothetical protein